MSGLVQPRADVVVIGGGIIGAACSYYLGAAGLKVCLVERHFPASGTSRAGEGLVLLWDKLPGAELSLGLASAALWPDLAGELDFDIGYARRGTLLVSESETDQAAGIAKAQALWEAGVRAEILRRGELLELEPSLAPDLAGGVLFPDDAHLDARRATLALIRAAQQRYHLALHTSAESTEICVQTNGGRRVRGVKAGGQEILTHQVVCAAGVWSNEVARSAGLALPIRPRKGQILVTSRLSGAIHHPVLEGGYTTTVQSGDEDLQVALVAELTEHGTLLLGSSRQFAGFDCTVSLKVMRAIAARAVRFLPTLAQAPVIRSYAGLRPWSPDHLPLIGPVESLPGFFLATGHEGAGIGLAPATGRLIADWISGAERPPYAGALKPDRFELIKTNAPGEPGEI